MAVIVNMIEQSQGVKFDSSALNGLRGLAAFHVMVFHSILYSNFSFSINGTVRSFIHIVQIRDAKIPGFFYFFAPEIFCKF